jgi:hypothetical protein
VNFRPLVYQYTSILLLRLITTQPPSIQAAGVQDDRSISDLQCWERLSEMSHYSGGTEATRTTEYATVASITLLDSPLKPNDPYRGRTAPLTPKRSILYIYSINIGTEYFKQGVYSPFFLFKMQFVS